MAATLPTPPPPHVRAAFGLPGATATALPGGQGLSWLVTPPAAAVGSDGPPAPLVLKPVADELQAEEVIWLAEALAPLTSARAAPAGLRLPRDIRAAAAGPERRWVVDGWRASTWVPGDAGPEGRWTELLAGARAFTTAVAHLPRPPFLDRRGGPWADADRAAWDEQPLPVHPDQDALVTHLRRLAGRGPRSGRPSQLVHGDLTGNVLFCDGLPPAVIDLSPYWRPAAYAGAVVVADALLWWDQGPHLLAAAGDSGAVDLVARALLFRLLTDVELLRRPDGPAALPAADAARYGRAAGLLELPWTPETASG
ncbi:aminoglycoside phosphotransferase [Quadrisphaera setariae]|uniref:Aminoglycoside phosphotransferase n=1 Tax=Quadrisphaera setariae TaxID=2593304 RepID=A0A5C8ZHI5_9ACTN|nr:aminoglycoside phosphotransferase [Quadrisphaera setariae]TXR57297.1 aminoglycoside phosphotransferase [Quadrisphaera setariae]